MKKMNLLALALVAVGAVASQNAMALSPPWVVYDNELKAMFASDSCVTVSDVITHDHGLQALDDANRPPQDQYEIHIKVCNEMQAHALAALLKPEANGATIEVFGPEGHLVHPRPLPTDDDRLISLFNAAFGTNCLYLGATEGKFLTHEVVYVEIAKAAVQFWADNISDPNGNITELAATAFADKLVECPSFIIFSSPNFISSCGGTTK